MKEIEWLKSLDRPEDPAEPIDVTASVLREIRTRGLSGVAEDVSPLAAILAALAGGGVVAVASYAWSSMLDPLASFVEPLRMVLQ